MQMYMYPLKDLPNVMVVAGNVIFGGTLGGYADIGTSWAKNEITDYNNYLMAGPPEISGLEDRPMGAGSAL